MEIVAVITALATFVVTATGVIIQIIDRSS